MKNKKWKYVLLCLALWFVVIGLKIYDIYRVKGLDEAISFEKRDMIYMGFTKDRRLVKDNQFYEWTTKDPDTAADLMDFLSQYKVKKEPEGGFINHLNEGEYFELNISNRKGKAIIVHFLENDVHVFVGHYYKVLNGPIDMDWIKEFSDKHKEEGFLSD
ncbi:hypothetical protein [Falsibacillus pallidus]|uniref:hypothetical protein n=1 Tax=Falsibacillus pallidus TaxID=493781 RepID=UPI003D99434D